MLLNNKLKIDNSHSQDGYLTVFNTKPVVGKKYKILVNFGEQSVNYNIWDQAIIPLQFGDGKYTIKLCQHKIAVSYTQIGIINLNIKLSSPVAPYLHTNQYVKYTPDSLYVKDAETLCAECTTDLEKVNKIYSHIVETYTYNSARAILLARSTTAIPNAEWVYTHGSGICGDIAALMTAMLRSQGIPTSLVIGLYGSTNHAWVRVYLDNSGTKFKDYDPTKGIKLKAARIKKTSPLKYVVKRWY